MHSDNPSPPDLSTTARRRLLQTGLRSLGELALRTVGAYLAGYAEAMPGRALPVRTRIRPPGARPEPEFVARCTRCDECIRACPFGALAPDEDGRPWLHDPAGHPCYMCEGFPCIAACGPSALTFADRRLRTIGLAKVDLALCVAHAGERCTACRDACRDARAIRLVDALPVVDPQRCTGCGICLGKCPSEPKALSIQVKG